MWKCDCTQQVRVQSLHIIPRHTAVSLTDDFPPGGEAVILGIRQQEVEEVLEDKGEVWGKIKAVTTRTHRSHCAALGRCAEDSNMSFAVACLVCRSQFTITAPPNMSHSSWAPFSWASPSVCYWGLAISPKHWTSTCQLADDLWSTVSHRFSPNPRGQPALDHCDNLMLL